MTQQSLKNLFLNPLLFVVWFDNKTLFAVYSCATLLRNISRISKAEAFGFQELVVCETCSGSIATLYYTVSLVVPRKDKKKER